MKRLIKLVLPCMILQSCSSINQPIASQDLVVIDHGFTRNTVTKSDSYFLQTGKSGDSVTLSSENVVLQDMYISALGLECRKVTLSAQLDIKVYCYDSSIDNWFFTKPVLSTYGKALK
ncbi:hypothetical protein [uncultured Paraglaciecola sp.]|uniref:hypothetical protein n=1 Tax=uncultured Paraglaciecola sp. TaxID=1765024 RepID=UPI002598EDEA|nr:hypothetical protein [uncultured Paraglaciecola sp.]